MAELPTQTSELKSPLSGFASALLFLNLFCFGYTGQALIARLTSGRSDGEGLSYLALCGAFLTVSLAINRRSKRAALLSWLATGVIAIIVVARGFVPLELAFVALYTFGTYKFQIESGLRSQSPSRRDG